LEGVFYSDITQLKYLGLYKTLQAFRTSELYDLVRSLVVLKQNIYIYIYIYIYMGPLPSCIIKFSF
jgi:hypothetical protein